MSTPHIIAVKTVENRIGFYDGTGFDTVIGKAKVYANKGVATMQGKRFVKLAGVKAVIVLPETKRMNVVKAAFMPSRKNALSATTATKKKRVIKKRSVTGKQYYHVVGRKQDGTIAILDALYPITKTEAKTRAAKLRKDGYKNITVFVAENANDALQQYIARTKKNPIQGSRKRRETKARTLFEDFTGHPADSFEIVTVPEYDTGLKVGKVLGIMYQTTRDGNIENYVHEFKKTSQPDFAVSHDGQQIFLIGGSYLFKDSGINDT